MTGQNCEPPSPGIRGWFNSVPQRGHQNTVVSPEEPTELIAKSQVGQGTVIFSHGFRYAVTLPHLPPMGKYDMMKLGHMPTK